MRVIVMKWLCSGCIRPACEVAYVVAASDLHAKRPPNSMMKYADDSHLLVGSRQISTVNEFSHIKAWAASNNLQLIPLKTRELIVYRRGLGASVDPAPI